MRPRTVPPDFRRAAASKPKTPLDLNPIVDYILYCLAHRGASTRDGPRAELREGERCRRTGTASLYGRYPATGSVVRRLRAGLVTPRSGDAGAPPGVITDPCQELADGMAARLARGSTGLGHPKGASLPSRKARRAIHRKARPGVVRKTPQNKPAEARGASEGGWSARRRPHSSKEDAATERLARRLALHPLDFFEGEESEDGLPGAGQKRGRRSIGYGDFEKASASPSTAALRITRPSTAANNVMVKTASN
jgi:hypothetical protein